MNPYHPVSYTHLDVYKRQSTYYITYPEIHLQEQYGRTDAIHSYMKEYLQKGVLEEQVHNGFILTERQTSTGIRIGLVGALDLEQYEFQENISAPVRATEGTITSRIPPRMLIRQGACLETSHVMVLLDDKKRQIIEPIYKEKSDLRKLYDFDLMLHAGHIRGYAIEGRSAAPVSYTHLDITATGDIINLERVAYPVYFHSFTGFSLYSESCFL